MFSRKSVYLAIIGKDIEDIDKFKNGIVNYVYKELSLMMPHIYIYAYNRSPNNHKLPDGIYLELDGYMTTLLKLITDNEKIVEVDIVDVYVKGKLFVIELSIWERKNDKIRTKRR